MKVILTSGLHTDLGWEKLQNLYLASSFCGQGVAEKIMHSIETLLGKPASEIKVSYIITAGNLHPIAKRTWIREGATLLERRGWQICEYDLAGKSEAEVRAELVDKDVVFVQGGNCFYLLQQMQKCNFGKVIKEALARGVPYIGESAGAIICSEDISPQKFLSGDSLAKVQDLVDFRGLGLINFLVRPHWNRQGEKRAKFFRPVQENTEEFFSITQPIVCLNDNQVVYVEGDNLQIWNC